MYCGMWIKLYQLLIPMQGHLLERRRGEDRKVLFFKIEHRCRQGTSSRVHSYADIYLYFVYFCIFWIYLYILQNYQPILRRQCYLHRCSMNNTIAKEILENCNKLKDFAFVQKINTLLLLHSLFHFVYSWLYT